MLRGQSARPREIPGWYGSVCNVHLVTQRSNAKIQRHFWLAPLRTSYEVEEKTYKTFVNNVVKIVLGEKITSLESLGMSISKFSGHMRVLSLTFQ